LKKRAVSPVVATLLLILVAVAAAAVLYAFVSGMMTRGAASAGAEYAQTQIVVESAVLKTTADSKANITSLYVRNTGALTIPAGNWTVILLDADGATVLGINATAYLSDGLPPGNVTDLTKPAGYIIIDASIKTGKMYAIKVVSPTGSSDVIRIKAQQP